MSTICRSSANAMKHPYMKRGFYLQPENRFWETLSYSNKERERLNELVQTFDHKNRMLLDLIK